MEISIQKNQKEVIYMKLFAAITILVIASTVMAADRVVVFGELTSTT